MNQPDPLSPSKVQGFNSSFKITPPQAILFDMDGVLVDSEQLHWETVGDVLRSHLGEKAPQLPPRIGWGDDELWTELKERFSLTPSPQELTIERDSWAIRRLKEHPPPPILHTIEVIQRWRISSPQLPLVVVSASPKSQMELSLREFVDLEGQSFFQFTLSGIDDVPYNKPHPAPYLQAMQSLKISPQDCWIAEDSNTGITAALASGAQVFAIGAQSVRSELLNQCHLSLNNLNQLYDLWNTFKKTKSSR